MYRIFKEGAKISPESPMAHFNLYKFAGEAKGDYTLIEYRINFKGLEKIRAINPTEKIVYLEIEEPNRFNSGDRAFRREEYENEFYKILTLCPYTTAWLNKKQGKNRRTAVFYPFDENNIPPPAEKKYDIIYIGNALAQELKRNIEIIRKFNYRYVGDTTYFEGVTDRNITYKEKLKLLSQCKIALVHNALILHGDHVTNVQKTKDFRENGAFAQIPDPHFLSPLFNKFSKKEYLVPQIKTRLFEAAFCRSLILCRKDHFNIVERFFEPDKEFVYYEEGKLEEKIKEILAHYDDYLPLIENAFKKATAEYTSRRFFEKFLRDLI